MEVFPEHASSVELYKILIGAVLPRPIAWVSTLDAAGSRNLAPFSFFTVASVDPPVLCFSPLLKDGSARKDTLVNIEATREFVVNVVSRRLAETMSQTSGPYPPGVDEFAAAGVAPRPSTVVKPPAVADALVNFECRLERIIALGARPLAGNLILGEICCIHLNAAVYRDGHVDHGVLDAVGRLGGDMYATTRDCFELPRPRLNQ